MDANTGKQIRAAVNPGNPFGLDELKDQLCPDDKEREAFSEIVTDEYHRRLAAMPHEQMLEFYRQFYKNTSDANKDWLLGEIVESIEAQRN